MQIDYPVGHRLRREEGIPLLAKKFEASVASKLKPGQWQMLQTLSSDPAQLKALPVDDFMALLVA